MASGNNFSATVNILHKATPLLTSFAKNESQLTVHISPKIIPIRTFKQSIKWR